MKDPLRASFKPTSDVQGTAVSGGSSSSSSDSRAKKEKIFPKTDLDSGTIPERLDSGIAVKKHLAKSAFLCSEKSGDHLSHTHLRARKPPSVSNLRFTSTLPLSDEEVGDGQVKADVATELTKSYWSPVSECGAIHENQMIPPCAAISAETSLESPRMPKSALGGCASAAGASLASISLAWSTRSPVFLAVEDGFRALMKGGGFDSRTPTSHRMTNTPQSPGLKATHDLFANKNTNISHGLKSPISPKSPKSPKRFAGFNIPRSKKSLRVALQNQSPRKVRFDGDRGSPSPRKTVFDDEGFGGSDERC